MCSRLHVTDGARGGPLRSDKHVAPNVESPAGTSGGHSFVGRGGETVGRHASKRPNKLTKVAGAAGLAIALANQQQGALGTLAVTVEAGCQDRKHQEGLIMATINRRAFVTAHCR